MTDYGSGYTEWSVACLDGQVWDDLTDERERAERWLTTADQDCGCDTKGHVLVYRDVPEWGTP